MRIHCLLHSHLGGEIYLPIWAAQKGYLWTSSVVPSVPSLPTPDDLDCLVVLGGPMSAWEEEKYPWLTAEKRLLECLIEAGKPILGICLGAQLVADVLGARTYIGMHKEIGWHLVEATTESRIHPVGAVLPSSFETFLWHGDSFDIPDGATQIARSAAFESQAFVWNRVLALQFHLEVRPDWVGRITARDAGELVDSGFVQSLDTILGKPQELYRLNNAIMERLLDRWLDHASL
ncbi:MAG: type 1 glutamine amidotransferase [Chromatiaceae bacterium]|nr:type 1 glutamine amidotransferase [Chromatiaceae bacterium]